MNTKMYNNAIPTPIFTPGITVKQYAEEQFAQDCYKVCFENNGISINNPWMDDTGRFEFTIENAISHYGALNMLKFYLTVFNRIPGIVAEDADFYKSDWYTIVLAAEELFNDQQCSHASVKRRLTGETACYRYEMLPNLGITLYDEFGFGERVYTGHMFSVMECAADAHGPYIYTTNGMLRIVRLTPDIIEVIDITGTPEGCTAADIYCSKFGTLDD